MTNFKPPYIKGFASRVCSFRASSFEDYQEWLKLKQYCKERGLDICHVVMALVRSWNKGLEGILEPETVSVPPGTVPSVVNVQMQNTFVYQPQRPRREPQPHLISSKRAFARTISSKAAELYFLWKVSGLERSFSYLDLSELPPNYARKLILRLKRKGLIKPIPPRTRPRFYVPLVHLELKPVDPFMPRNNRVRQLFTSPSGW